MTAKRFALFEDLDIIDNSNGKIYPPCLDKGLTDLVDLLNELHEEKEMWKRECQRLKGLYYLENEEVELDDIIGLVKTDEPTDSVELKKELYK